MKCKDCKWSIPPGSKLVDLGPSVHNEYQCRHDPPQVLLVPGQTGHPVLAPVHVPVAENDYCSHWEPKLELKS